MGSLFSQNTPTPTPPAPPAAYRDEIGGTEQVPVKNADGSVTYITRKLPLTAEEQAEQDAYDKLMKDALSEIEKLSSSDYVVDDSTQNILNAWSNERSSLIEDNFDTRTAVEEQNLARRGLSSSSAGDNTRRQRLLDEQGDYKTLENEKVLMADDVRQKNLAYQQNLYNLAAGRNNLEEAQALSSAANGVSAVNAANSYNRASIMDYYSRQTAQSNQQSSAFGQTVNAIGSAVNAGTGGLYGSLFKGIF